jgi:hypothetical protein
MGLSGAGSKGISVISFLHSEQFHFPWIVFLGAKSLAWSSDFLKNIFGIFNKKRPLAGALLGAPSLLLFYSFDWVRQTIFIC